jgi:hypothetical protein
MSLKYLVGYTATPTDGPVVIDEALTGIAWEAHAGCYIISLIDSAGPPHADVRPKKNAVVPTCHRHSAFSFSITIAA